MPHTLKEDYSSLLGFIDDYSLKGVYSEKCLISAIKPMHKGYYSALVLMAELQHQRVRPHATCDKNHKDKQIKIFWTYLAESFSELGSAFFLILNGCYKAANQVLRSSIENFIKAHGSLDYIGIHQIKNVYEVLEKSGSCSFFSDGIGKNIHSKLCELYGILCSTVHTGTEQDMQNISALGDFPAIDPGRVVETGKRYLKIVKLFISSLSVMFSTAFHKMHHRNRDIVQLSLSSKALRELHEK